MTDVHAQNVILNVPTPTEEETSYLGPAVYSNRFSVSAASVVRIAFLEQEFGTTKLPHFRTAVTLSHQDAIALANLLKTMLVSIEEQLKTMTSDQPSSGATRDG